MALCQRMCGKCLLAPSLTYQDNQIFTFSLLRSWIRNTVKANYLTELTIWRKEKWEKLNKRYKTVFDLTHQSGGTHSGAGVGFVSETERLWSPPEISCFQRILWSRSLPRLFHSSTPVRRQEERAPTSSHFTASATPAGCWTPQVWERSSTRRNKSTGAT